MSNTLQPTYTQEVIEYAAVLESRLTPRQREQRDREARIDAKWDLLRKFVQSEMERHAQFHEDHICCALEDVLDAMDKLERGDAVGDRT